MKETRRVGLRVTFDQLALIYKSLEAAKTLAVLSSDDLLEETIQLVDQALNDAIR